MEQRAKVMGKNKSGANSKEREKMQLETAINRLLRYIDRRARRTVGRRNVRRY